MLDVGVTEGDDDCGERVGGGGDKEVGGGDDDGAPGCIDGKEDEDELEGEGAAKARTAARRTKTAKERMDVPVGAPCKPVGGGWGKGGTARGELEKKNIYRIGYRFGSIQIGSAKREAYQ